MSQQLLSGSLPIKFAAGSYKISYFPHQIIMGRFVNILDSRIRERMGIAAANFCEKSRGGGVRV